MHGAVLLIAACSGGGGGGGPPFQLNGSSPELGSTDASYESPILLVFSRPADLATSPFLPPPGWESHRGRTGSGPLDLEKAHTLEEILACDRDTIGEKMVLISDIMLGG